MKLNNLCVWLNSRIHLNFKLHQKFLTRCFGNKIIENRLRTRLFFWIIYAFEIIRKWCEVADKRDNEWICCQTHLQVLSLFAQKWLMCNQLFVFHHVSISDEIYLKSLINNSFFLLCLQRYSSLNQNLCKDR